MDPTSEKKKPSIWQIDAAGLCVCGVATLAAAVFVIMPLTERRTALARQEEQLAGQRQKSEKLGSAVASLRRHTTGLQKELASAQIRLDSADRINQRIADLTTGLARHGLDLDDIRTGQILIGPMCVLVPMSLSGRGDYPACVAFLREIDQTCPDMTVARFDLAGYPETSRGGQFMFDLFWFAAPSAQTPQD